MPERERRDYGPGGPPTRRTGESRSAGRSPDRPQGPGSRGRQADGSSASVKPLAASSLAIGALVALRFRIGLRAIGLILALGAMRADQRLRARPAGGEAISKSGGHGAAIAGLLSGLRVILRRRLAD